MDLQQALRWLNWEKGSRISEPTRFWLTRFDDPGLDDAERLEIATYLQQMTSGLEDPLERAEVFTYLAVFFDRLMQMRAARQMIGAANDLYRNLEDMHRQGITAWMRYLILRSCGSYPAAFRFGKEARDCFRRMAVEYDQKNQAGTRAFYDDLVTKIVLNLLSTPEDLYEWLFEFDGSLLSIPAQSLKEDIQRYLEENKFSEADRLLVVFQDMINRRAACDEKAEALAFLAVVEWIMENPPNALYFVRSALAQSIPYTHAYAMLRWMMGLMQNNIPNLNAESYNTLDAAMQDVDDLRANAVERNEIDKADRYTIILAAMREKEKSLRRPL